MTVRECKHGEFVYRSAEEGKKSYQIVSGHVRLYVLSPDGKEHTYIIFDSGSCFGEMSLIDVLPRFHMAQALGTVRLNVLAKHDFERLWSAHIEIAQELCRLFCMRERRVFASFDQSKLDTLPVKIAHRLLDLASTLGNDQWDGVHFNLRITQEDIGSMAGASRQSVNKIFQQWSTQGIIRLDYGTIVITNLRALQNMIDNSRKPPPAMDHSLSA